MKPKYTQVYEALVQRIDQMNPGDQLESETKLAASFDVSPMTVRRALMLLSQEGLTVGFPGKGTFVSAKNTEPRGFQSSFTQQMLDQGKIASARLVSASIEESDAEYAELFNITLGCFIYRINRVRYSDGVPVGIEVTTLNADRFPGILGENLTDSLYKLLEDKYDFSVDRSSSRMSAVLATEEEAALFEVSRPYPCLHKWTKLCDADGKAVAVTVSTFRGDYCTEDTRVK